MKLIFTATEDYAKKWAKKENQEYECLQDWVQHVKQMVRCKVNSLRKTIESKRQGILEMNLMKECLKELQEKYVFVPADKVVNNIIVVCKRNYLEVICNKLGLWPSATCSDTYVPETLDPKEISRNHISYMKSLGFKEGNLSDKFPSFIGLQSPTKHHRSIVLSLHQLTAQQNICVYSLPVSYLPSKGNCQACHQSYTVTQVSMECGFGKTALNCCRK